MNGTSEKSKLRSGRKAGAPKGKADILRGAPDGVVRLIAHYAKMKGAGEQAYWDLVRGIASDAGATGTRDYQAVIDIAEATFDGLRLRKAKNDVIECMRERHRDELALQECRTASAQRDLAEHVRADFVMRTKGLDDQEFSEKYEYCLKYHGDPLPPEIVPPYKGVYSKSDIGKFSKPADTPADDGRAFLDAMGAPERIEVMINDADRRRDKVWDDIVTRRRKCEGASPREIRSDHQGSINGDESDE